MLSRLLTLAILLAIAYLLVTEALPLLTRQLGGGTAMRDRGTEIDSEDGRCVDQAERANERLTSAARRHGQSETDVDAWASAVWEIESQLQSAATACMCASEACRAGTDAVEEMRELLRNLDGMMHGEAGGFANPANQQERIFRHLEAARDAAGF